MQKKVTKSTKKKKKTLKDLSIAQREKLFFKKCKTKQELSRWIKTFLGLYMPDEVVSRFADCSPLDMIWELYDICVNCSNPDNIMEILFVAGRGSGKTLGCAIAEFMILMHDRRDAVHVGAVMAQAKRCYDYQVKFMLNANVKSIIDNRDKHESDRIIQKMNMEKSIFNFDGEQVSLEILPCTLKALNGPHVPLVTIDEIDTVSGEGLKAFREISGMLDSKGGKRALRVGISTRKSRYGLMNKQIENAEEEGRTVRRWTALEFSQRCPDSRSGTTPTVAYTMLEDMEMISAEEYKRKNAKKKREYTQVTLPGENCLTCPAAAICLGDAKKQKSKSWMLKPIDEYIQKVRSEGADWALSQLMNLKPSLEGVIYKEFDPRIHVKTWNEMWLRLVGKEFPGECTHDIFVKKCHQLKIPCYGGIDWGWSKPSTITYAFIDKRDNVYVVKTDGMTFVSDPEWIHYIKHKYHNIYRPQLYFPDQASQGSVIEMRKAGLLSHCDPHKPDVNPGIQVIKKLLRVPGSADTKIVLAKETCQSLINEFGLYHFKTSADGTISNMIDTENDHWLDGLRYILHELLGKAQFLYTGEAYSGDNKVTDQDGNFYHAPNAEEYAKVMGIQVNINEEDISKLGKIGTLNDLDDDDDDDGSGMLWNF